MRKLVKSVLGGRQLGERMRKLTNRRMERLPLAN
jgi:hypothetical protein